MTKLLFITGGSASGKTHLAHELLKSFKERAVLISQDSFYKPDGSADTNYDVPKAFDFDKMREVFEGIQNKDEIEIPTYDFAKHDVVGSKVIDLREKNVIIFEGLFTLYDKKLASLADLKVFVDTPADTRISRRILRDIDERGRKIEDIINRWIKDVQPAYKQYIAPVKKTADLIIPWSSLNSKSLQTLIITISHVGLDDEEILNHKH